MKVRNQREVRSPREKQGRRRRRLCFMNPGFELLELRQLLAEVVTIGTPTPVTVSNSQQVMQFTLTRTPDTNFPPDSLPALTVTYSTVDGTAHAGTDYVGQTNQTVTFASGSLTAQVNVAILPEPSTGWGGQTSRTFSLKVTAAKTPLFSSGYQGPPYSVGSTVDIATGEFRQLASRRGGGQFRRQQWIDPPWDLSDPPLLQFAAYCSRWTANLHTWRPPTSSTTGRPVSS